MSAPDAASREPGLARSASILGLGNIASRVIGLVREAVIAGFYGSGGELSAFNLAARVPTMIYDLLVGGMLSAALVPVFSDYARRQQRDELARVASAVFSLIALIMAAIVVLLELFAAPLAGLLGNFEDPALQRVLMDSLRLISPAVLFFGLSGAATGLLYALRRFSYTAVSGAVFNLGIVLAVPLLAPRLHVPVYALPIGVVVGSVLQLVVLLPGLRGIRIHLSAAWQHPAVRRIMRLYLPIALGLIVTQVQIVVDGRWASATGSQSVAWMRYATTLIQFPLGLVPVAVSLAALPTLARHAADAHWDSFRSVFGRGLRLVLLLLLPATAGLWVLAEPIIRLVLEHGVFSPADTGMTATALRLYLLGLPFAGVDFLLNYTFYARQNTRTPAIVGVISIGVYFMVAATLKGSLGFLGLVLADSAKQAAHAAIMIVLLLRSVGRLHHENILGTLALAGAASVIMALAVSLFAGWLVARLPASFLGEFLVVLLAGTAGGGLYLLALQLLGARELSVLVAGVSRRLTRRRGQ